MILVLPCVAVSLSSCASYYALRYKHIDLDDVDSIQLSGGWVGYDVQRELTAEETEEFLELYNAAKKTADRKASDTTPKYTVTILLKNGKALRVHDYPYYGHDHEIQHGNYNHRFFINSEEPDEYIESLY